MPSIHLIGVGFAHATVPVLDDVRLDLADDPVHVRPDAAGSWVGVVGANGAGKSTLLGLLAGRLHATAGEVVVRSSLPPVLVEQQRERLPDAVATFVHTWDGPALRWRSRLGLDVERLLDGPGAAWRTLSPGERTRWQVAAALAADADVLLLDEPTNHLDGEGRALLLDALRRHRGLGLVVSHDRTLLDALTSRTLRLEGGTATLHAGPHGEAAVRWREQERAARDRAEVDARRLRREQAALGDIRRARHGAEASARRDRRVAGPRDSDAREVGRKVAAARAERSIAARVAAQRTRVTRASQAVAAAPVGRDHRGSVGFRDDGATTGAAGRVLAHVAGPVPHAGGGVVLDAVDITLRDGDRVHLAGPNGAGKSSLLHAVLAEVARRHPQLTVAALPQEDDPDGVGWLDGLGPDVRGRVLGTAARLGVVPAHVLDRGATSPGERRKLLLARLLVEPCALLVLDEPTNHLDLPSVERLQEALAGWAGSLLLVTHDDALADAATDVRWELPSGWSS